MHQDEVLADVLRFFENREPELALYRRLEAEICARFPVQRIRVQQTQIAFWASHPFAIVSLRRARGWPDHCITVTFGLDHRLDSARIAQVVEPYPNRWTHHVAVSRPEQIDDELLGWIGEAHRFSESKRKSSPPCKI